jgi:hypothetical protein
MFPDGLPSEHLLRATLIKRGFTEKALDVAVRVYLESSELAEALISDRSTESVSPPSGSGASEQLTTIQNHGVDKAGTQQTMSVPISAGRWVNVSGSFPISKVEWRQFLAVLVAMEPALTIEREAHGAEKQSSDEAE